MVNARRCAAVMLAVLALLAGGCARPRMPAGWPLPELTLPPQSVVCEVLAAERSWGVEFKCRGGKQAVREHIEGRLRAMGYRKRDVGRRSDYFAYLAQDGMLEVTLTFIENAAQTRQFDNRVPDFSLDVVSLYEPSPELKYSTAL